MAEFKLTCPACETPLKLSSPVAAGKQVRCPGCKTVFRVPEDESNVVATEDESDVVVAEEVEEGETHARPKPIPVSRHAVTRSNLSPASAKELEENDAEPPVRRAAKPVKTLRRDNTLFLGMVAALIGAVLAAGIYLTAKNTAGKKKKSAAELYERAYPVTVQRAERPDRSASLEHI